MSWFVVYFTPTAEQAMFDPPFALFLAGWPRSGDYGLLVELIEASVGTGIPGAEPQRRREQSRVGPLPRRLVSFESTSSDISRQWSGSPFNQVK